MTKESTENDWALTHDGNRAHLQMELQPLKTAQVFRSQYPVLPTKQLIRTFNVGGYGGGPGYSYLKHYDLFLFFPLL